MASEENTRTIYKGNGKGGKINSLEKRILEISYKKKLSHIGSCLSAVNIINKIYEVKKPTDPFILDNAHASLALYVVLEQWEFKNAEMLFDKHGVHCNRDMENGIWASGGSLSHGIGIGVGMALADRTRDVYVLTSDGAMAEGSNWEALRIASDLKIENLRVTVNMNGFGAYSKIDTEILDTRMQMFYPSLGVSTNTFSLPSYLNGLEAHYTILSEEQFKEVMKSS